MWQQMPCQMCSPLPAPVHNGCTTKSKPHHENKQGTVVSSHPCVAIPALTIQIPDTLRLRRFVII